MSRLIEEITQLELVANFHNMVQLTKRLVTSSRSGGASP